MPWGSRDLVLAVMSSSEVVDAKRVRQRPAGEKFERHRHAGIPVEIRVQGSRRTTAAGTSSSSLPPRQRTAPRQDPPRRQQDSLAAGDGAERRVRRRVGVPRPDPQPSAAWQRGIGRRVAGCRSPSSRRWTQLKAHALKDGDVTNHGGCRRQAYGWRQASTVVPPYSSGATSAIDSVNVQR